MGWARVAIETREAGQARDSGRGGWRWLAKRLKPAQRLIPTRCISSVTRARSRYRSGLVELGKGPDLEQDHAAGRSKSQIRN